MSKKTELTNFKNSGYEIIVSETEYGTLKVKFVQYMGSKKRITLGECYPLSFDKLLHHLFSRIGEARMAIDNYTITYQ